MRKRATKTRERVVEAALSRFRFKVPTARGFAAEIVAGPLLLTSSE